MDGDRHTWDMAKDLASIWHLRFKVLNFNPEPDIYKMHELDASWYFRTCLSCADKVCKNSEHCLLKHKHFYTTFVCCNSSFL